MRYQQRKELEAERDYYMHDAEIARARLIQERKEHNDRLKDRAFILALIVVTGLTIIMCHAAFHEFALWASGR